MALIPCKECKAEISSSAKHCPQCGAKPKKSTSVATYFVGAIFLFAFAKCSWDQSTRSAPPAAPVLTPAQAAKKAEDDAHSSARFVNTSRLLSAIKNSLREPDSVIWGDILASEKGDVVCVAYRAKNGFGGMNLEHTVMTTRGISSSGATWNKSCVGKTLFDTKSALHTLP